MGRKVSGTTIKDTWTKPRVEAREGGVFGWGGWGWGWEKMQTIVIEQQ